MTVATLVLGRRHDGALGERFCLVRGAGGEARDRAELLSLLERGGITLEASAAREVLGSGLGGAQHVVLAPGVRMISVRTPTLPPATHTNVVVVGDQDAVLVEPAPVYDDEIDRLLEWIAQLEEEENVAIGAILLTHHHADHAGGLRALREALGAPVMAHERTAARLSVPVERTLEDGARIELGGASLRAVHTPGHAPGHLCFLEERSGVMIAGDMVAGQGTILIEPVEGDMALYLDSLARMQRMAPSALAPAHGGVLRPPEAVLQRYVAHRLERERKVLAALREADRALALDDIVRTAYADVPRASWPLAALSTEAHLIKLAREGKAAPCGGRWRASA